MAVTRCTVRIILALVVGATAIVARSERVSACSCVGPIPVCQAVWQTDAVFTADGRPAADVKVYLKGGGPNLSFFGEPVTTDRNGRFAITVPAGHSYRLSAEHVVTGKVVGRVETPPFEAVGELPPFTLRIVPVAPRFP